MTVFVVHPIKDKAVDITSALIHGEVKHINHRYIYADELEGDDVPSEFENKMLKAVDEFDPDHDFLLIAGDHLQIVAMAAYLSARWGRFKVLRYDRQAGGYLVVNINAEI